MKKILMVLMGLDIGGAETHVVGLSLALKELGWEVLVASNGGVYEQDLSRAGIRHFQIPTDKRALPAMRHSLRRLRQIIQEEQPDLVHAHARIPAFLCGILHRQMGFPFVTTAHWVFRVNPLLRCLTDWGQETIAVSSDIRDYLIDRYDLPAGQIHVTVNGIDTEQFSPKISGDRIRQEFDLPASAPVITCVTRLHESRARSAQVLLESAPALAGAIPGLRILLVGDGGQLEALRQQAQRVNGSLGYDCVLLTGSRTDIPELVAAGDVFVGVSRAALEAMSCGKPTVLCGNEGYGGLATEAHAQENRATNYCCRGGPESTASRLTEDLLRLFAMEADARKALGLESRALVVRDFSLMTMARDCEKVYELALHPRKKIVISGYYGYGNLGDDTILKALCREYGEEYDLTVLSKTPRQTAKAYGITAIPRFHPFKVRKIMKESALLLFGGGSLLQDRTSTRSLLYYLHIIHMAQQLRLPVMVYANGIGPVRGEKNRRLVAETLNHVTAITLRDEDSLAELQSMGVTGPMTVTADPVFSMEPEDHGAALDFLHAAGIPTDRPLLGVSLRNVSHREAELLGQLLDEIAQRRGCIPVFLCMQPSVDHKTELPLKCQSYSLPRDCTAEQMMGAISCMEAVISMRLHTLIFAAAAGTPILGFDYDPKLTSLLNTLHMPSLGPLEDLEVSAAAEKILDVIDHRDAYQAAMVPAVDAQRQRVRQNDVVLRELLNGGSRKRVAIFQTDLHVGGIQKALINSVCSPVFENTDVEIYLFDDQVFFDISLLPENVSIHFLKPFPFLWRLFPYGVIRHIARPFPISGAFDAAIDFNSYQHTCAFGALSVPAKKRVMWIHNDMEIKLHEEGKYRLLWYAMRGKYPYYTHFAAVSEGIIPAFRRCSSPVDRPIVAIPNLINTDEIWEKAQEPTDIHVDPAKFNIVSVGRLCHQKGFDLMLEDIRKVYEKRPDIACYIIGDGPDRDALKRQAAKLGIQDVVHFTGNLPNPFPVVRQMDAFCLESRYEGQGIVLWEAKSLGLPLYFPRRLEKYNPSLTGTDDLVEALIQAKRTEKKFDPLVEYNQEVCQRLSQLLFD